MVAEGHRCPACGGEIALVPSEPPVAVGSAREEPAGGDEASGGRRFERDS
jgi:hypothetical protein